MATELVTFHGFPMLPNELQRTIWQYVLPLTESKNGNAVRRVIRVELCWDTSLNTQERLLIKLGRVPPHRQTSDSDFFGSSPDVLDLAMTSTCKESRDVYLNNFRHELPLQRYGNSRPTTFRFDDDTIIYIHNFHRFAWYPIMRLLVRQDVPSTPSVPIWTTTVKNLAVPGLEVLDDFDSSPHRSRLERRQNVFTTALTTYFGNLVSLSLIGGAWELQSNMSATALQNQFPNLKASLDAARQNFGSSDSATLVVGFIGYTINVPHL